MQRRFLMIFGVIFGVALIAAFGGTGSITAGEAPAPLLHGTPDPQETPEFSSSETTIDNPTYYRDIEPILQQNCAACHQEGGIGYAFFSVNDLETMTDPDTAEYIAWLIGTGYMPPWPPSDESLPMAHERNLTDEEIALITRWIENGTPLGDESDRATTQVETNIPQIREDLVLTMPEPYTPLENSLDDYRCFLVDPEFETDTLITGADFRPGNTEIAHHALFFVIDENMVPQAEAQSGADGRPGWECFGGISLQSNSQISLADVDQQALLAALNDQGVDVPTLLGALNEYQQANDGPPDIVDLQQILIDNGVDVRRLIMELDINVAAMSGTGMGGSIGGWVPGSVPVTSPTNTGILVPANSQIVVQMHYNQYVTTGSDQSSLILETAPYTEDMTPLRAQPLVAPVEIPCPEGLEDPACDREISRQETINPNTANMLLAACGQTLETYTDNTADNAYGYCDYPINFDGWVLGVGPHMHEIGKSARIVLNPDTSDETVLIDIPEWDFHWQGQYSFAQPVELQPGDTIRVECWWDNSDGERYVTWGEGTQDEMCFNFTRFLIREEGKTLADYGYDMVAHDHHEMVEINDETPIPDVQLTITETESGGYFVQLNVENFTFAPQSVDTLHVPGEGHAHLYINGEKVTRLYGNEYYLDSLPAGEVEIQVTLTSNDHRIYAHHGEMIADTVMLQVE